jgi:type IV pilus assembly protein PilA
MKGNGATQDGHASATRRGFTLVELMVGVGMVFILASLAFIGYRKYINAAHTAEPRELIEMIRATEEVYKNDNLQYLGIPGDNCSTTLNGDWYPTTPARDQISNFDNPASPEYRCWRKFVHGGSMNVRFGYSVMAGLPGTAMPTPSSKFTTPPAYPSPPTTCTSIAGATVCNPVGWYVIEAGDDQDANGVWALFIASSLQGQEMYVENEGE